MVLLQSFQSTQRNAAQRKSTGLTIMYAPLYSIQLYCVYVGVCVLRCSGAIPFGRLDVLLLACLSWMARNKGVQMSRGLSPPSFSARNLRRQGFSILGNNGSFGVRFVLC